MNEQMQKQFHKRQYPLVRYLGLLLAVALLFTGVTFARYATNSGIAASVGIAAFDVDYTIEGVNSTTFGNMDYWQSSGGAWLEQGAGSARTVRIQFTNNGGVAVQPTLRLSGPAAFWENIALQLALGDGDDVGGTFASASLSTQYVIADLLRVRTGGVNVDGKTPAAGEETHNYTYNDYINWDTDNWDTEPANGATQDQEGVCVFDTAFSDQFGQLGYAGAGQDEQLLGETLQMSGSMQASGGSVTAERASKYDENGAISDVAALTMTITGTTKAEQYSVGYARRDSHGGLPALYLDCQKEMLYYTIDIEAEALTVPAGGSISVILFMTWTNSVAPVELTDAVQIDKEKMTELLAPGGMLTDNANKNVAEVLGYHFNDNAVPVCIENGSPIIEENGEQQLTTVRITNTFGESGISSTSYEHIASLSGDDSPFPHLMKQHSETIYKCSNTEDEPTYVNLSGVPTTVDASTVAFDMSKVDDGVTRTYTVASEIGYTTDFRVVLEQASEAPAAQQP